MSWLQDGGVKRYANRDIIVVSLPSDVLQPFYRSTGQNSGMPGVWLPFDGLSHGGTWFHKQRFTSPTLGPLNGFGTDQLKTVSAQLADRAIPRGEDMGWQEINAWMLRMGVKLWNQR